jgi:hypothetical protein
LTVNDTPDVAKEPISHPAVAQALRTLQTFTREQVAWLMSTAMRWGYELRVDEENAAYPPTPVFQLGRWFDQAEQRQKADADAKLPRLGDHPGGPAELWGDSLEAAA